MVREAEGQGQDSGDARLAGGGRSSRTMCQAREREIERLVSNPHIVTNKKGAAKEYCYLYSSITINSC